MTMFEKPQEWIDELDNARQLCHNHLLNSTRLQGAIITEEALVAVTAIGDLLRGSVIPPLDTSSAVDPETLETIIVIGTPPPFDGAGAGTVVSGDTDAYEEVDENTSVGTYPPITVGGL